MGNTFSLSGPFLVVIRALRIIYADMGLIAVYVAVETGPPLWHVSISTGGSNSNNLQKHNHFLMFSELFSQTQPPRWCFSTRAFLGSTFHVSNLQGPPPRDYDDKISCIKNNVILGQVSLRQLGGGRACHGHNFHFWSR